MYAGTGSVHLVYSSQSPLIDLNREKCSAMAYGALHMKVPTGRDQRVTLRPVNRRDLTRSVGTSVTRRSRVLARARKQQVAVCPFGAGASYQGVVEELEERGWGWVENRVWCCSTLHAAWGVLLIFFLTLLLSDLVLRLARSTHTKHTRMCCSCSTHSLVSGNLNVGVSYTGKTPVLQKMKRRGRNRRTGQELGLVHALPYHAHQNFSFK